MGAISNSTNILYPLFSSGAHINPAVTLAFASVQRFPLWKVPIYIISQMLGGIISAAFVYAIYHGTYCNGPRKGRK